MDSERISTDELDAILNQHKLWLDTQEECGTRADLRNKCLNGKNLSNLDLRKAILSQASLEWANLSNANLSQADLTDTALSHADLSHSILIETLCLNANLSHANLTQAEYHNADFRGTNFYRTIVTGGHGYGLTDDLATLNPHDNSDAVGSLPLTVQELAHRALRCNEGQDQSETAGQLLGCANYIAVDCREIEEITWITKTSGFMKRAGSKILQHLNDVIADVAQALYLPVPVLVPIARTAKRPRQDNL